jgi:hypothetical protein
MMKVEMDQALARVVATDPLEMIAISRATMDLRRYPTCDVMLEQKSTQSGKHSIFIYFCWKLYFCSSLGGGMISCPMGECANVTVLYGTLIVSVHTCDPFTLCDALNISYGCNKDFLGGGITACCCGDSNACNYRDPSSVLNITYIPPDTSVQCFTGEKWV